MNQPSFLHNIPSIHQKHPAIPAVLANLDLNRGVVAGDPLDYEEVTHANAVVTALKAYKGELGLRFGQTLVPYEFVDTGDPLVTPEMIQTASSRAVAIETACRFHFLSLFVSS